MNKRHLATFVKLILSEDESVRVPTQLLSPKDIEQQEKNGTKANGKHGDDEDQDGEIAEFCSAGGGGAIMGMTAPSNVSRRSKKR